MTQSQTTQTVRGGELAVRTRWLDPIAARDRAGRLQRRGLTLSEIAEEMDCRRDAIVHMLYWEKVRS